MQRLVFVFFMFAALCGAVLVGAQSAEAALTIDNITLEPGQTSTVTVRLDCGTVDCALYSVSLRFAPGIIRVDSIEFGGFLGSIAGGQAFVVENVIDNVVGEVRVAAAAMGVPTPTDDVLFRMTVTAIFNGTTAFQVGRIELGDAAVPPAKISATAFGGNVTVRSQPTETRRPTVTPTPTPTPRASAPSATPMTIPLSADALPFSELGRADAGPFNGQLFSEDDGFIEVFEPEYETENFAAQITVRVPNPIPEEWTFGFLFRDAGTNQQLRLGFSVNENGAGWALDNRTGENSTRIATEQYRTPVSGQITIQLIAVGDFGAVFWDGDLVSTLDLSSRSGSGDVSFGIDFYSNSDGVMGTLTYSNFAIWNLDDAFSPASGNLPHDNDNFVEILSSNLEVADFVAQATFSVPFTGQDWDFGFLFRELGGDDQYRLVIVSTGNWYLYEPGNIDTSFQRGTLNLNTGSGQSNTLTLIAIGEVGLFFINGALIDRLDLSARTISGDFVIAVGINAGHERVGSSTRYSGVNLWR